jgi:hypothetical protein
MAGVAGLIDGLVQFFAEVGTCVDFDASTDCGN